MKLNKSKILIISCFCFLLGISGQILFSVEFFIIYSLLIFDLVFLFLFFCKELIRYLLIFLLFFILGLFRVAWLVDNLDKQQSIAAYNDSEKITFVAIINDEVENKVNKQNLYLSIQSVHEKTGERQCLGKVLAVADLYPKYHYGQRLEVKCLLKTPFTNDEFSYQNYLKIKDVYSICYFPEIRVIDQNQGNWFKAWLLALKESFLVKFQKYFPGDTGALLSGLLLGFRSSFSSQLSQDFSQAGISHLVAISGSNITIIITSFNTFLLALGLARRKAFYFVVIGIGLFTVITGAAAATTRAAIMGIVLLLAQFFYRQNKIINSLMLSASIMVLLNPYILFYDLGFGLSFLATLGLVYFFPIWQDATQKVSDFLGLKSILGQTICCTLLTSPLIFYNFSKFSLVSFIANLVILPLIPLIMAIGFSFILISFLGGYLVFLDKVLIFLSWPVWFMARLVNFLAHFFANLPAAYLEFNISKDWRLVVLVCSYLLIFFVYWLLNNKTKKS